MTESSTPRTDYAAVAASLRACTDPHKWHAADVIDELCRSISEVPAMRWIPVEERMPKPVPRVVLSQGLDSRPCTCHPDDNPPVPCPRKFALSECRKAAGVRVLTDFTESMALLKDA